MPYLAVRDGDVHLPEELFRMVAGIEDAMILTDQLTLGIFADGAEFLIDVGDGALDVGYGDDGMLIERKFLVRKFFEGSFACAEAFLYCQLDPFPFGDVACNF